MTQGKIGKQALAVVVLLCSISLGLASMISWGPVPEQGADISLLSSDATHTTLEVQLQGVETGTIIADGKECTIVSIPGSPKVMNVGFPEVPMIRQALIIPDRGDVVVSILEVETRDIPCEMVVPSKGHLTRNIDPATVPFIFSDFYRQDLWFPEAVVAHDDPFIIRDFRGTVIQVNAVRFNPAQKVIRVVTRIVLDVRTEGDGGLNVIDRMDPVVFVDWEFNAIYDRLFVNYNETDYVPIPEPGRMFIITHPSFLTAIQDFYEWKLQKGIPVELYTLDQTGYSSTQIKTFIQNAYNSPSGITYIVLVGDIDQVPTIAGVYEGADSDPCYVKLAGSDNYPDAFISRISATSPSAVEYQAYKFIRYEMTPDTGPTGAWYHKGTGIGGDDTGATSLADWERCELLRQVLLAYNYTEIDQIYHASATAAQVTTAVNNGRGLINYIGHGATTYWGTTGFSNTNVYALSNGWMQPFIIDVACVNGDFSYGECFAEAWLRAGSIATPKGAVGIYASSTNASWVPPCDMQTHCVDLICTESRNTLGGICFNGVMYAMDIWGAGNSQEGNKLMEQTNLFGDCNLMLRTDTPAAMTAVHDPVLFLGMNTFTVQVPGQSGLLACLYANGIQYGTAYTNSAGTAQILMASPPAVPMTLTLTVSGYNKNPYIQDIDVLPASGPYLICDSLVVTDLGNPNGLVEYGETVRLSVWLENVGVGNAVDVEATLSSTDRYVTITDGSESYGTIIQGQNIGRTNAFELTVDGEIPDGHIIQLLLSVTADSGRPVFDSPLTIEAHSAALQISGFVIDDYSGNGNGILEAGETADLTLTLANNGSVGASSLVGALSTDSPYLQIVVGSSNHSGINPGGTGTFAPDYQVSVQAGCPNFTPAVFYVAINGSRSFEAHVMKPVTLAGFQEIVESGQGSWTHEAGSTGWNDQWHISTTRSHTPTHSWKCGDTAAGTYLSHMDAALITPPLTIPDGCQLTFWHVMDAEASPAYTDSAYDGGIVEVSVNNGPWAQITPGGGYTHYIRCVAGGTTPYTGPFAGRTPCWSGTFSWRQSTFDLTGYSGSVRIRFRFGSDNAEQREGWYVDDIQIDVGGGLFAPVNLEASLAGGEVTLTWSSPGVNPTMSLLSYNIYRDGAKIDSMVYCTEYADDLTPWGFGTYQYQVSAQYDNGESPLTTPISVSYTGSLEEVENLCAKVIGADIRLDWTPVVGATAYRIYYGRTPDVLLNGDEMIVIGTTSDLYFIHEGIVSRRAAGFYYVTATNE